MCVVDTSVGLTTNTLLSVVGSDNEPGTYMTGVAGTSVPQALYLPKGMGIRRWVSHVEVL